VKHPIRIPRLPQTPGTHIVPVYRIKRELVEIRVHEIHDESSNTTRTFKPDGWTWTCHTGGRVLFDRSGK
jgi:hypothetical protein